MLWLLYAVFYRQLDRIIRVQHLHNVGFLFPPPSLTTSFYLVLHKKLQLEKEIYLSIHLSIEN